MGKFREKRSRDVEKSEDGKMIKTRVKYNSLPLDAGTVITMFVCLWKGGSQEHISFIISVYF